MLNPPAPPAPPAEVDKAPKRSEATFIHDRLKQQSDGWMREVSFWFEGEEHWYGLHTHCVEEDARRVLYGTKPDKELYDLFLRDVQLDTTRVH